MLGCIIQRFNVRKGRAAKPYRNNIEEIKNAIRENLLDALEKVSMSKKNATNMTFPPKTKHEDTGQWMKTSASETRIFDRIENFYKRHRVRQLVHGLREFLTIGLGHPKFRSFIAYNC